MWIIKNLRFIAFLNIVVVVISYFITTASASESSSTTTKNLCNDTPINNNNIAKKWYKILSGDNLLILNLRNDFSLAMEFVSNDTTIRSFNGSWSLGAKRKLITKINDNNKTHETSISIITFGCDTMLTITNHNKASAYYVTYLPNDPEIYSAIVLINNMYSEKSGFPYSKLSDRCVNVRRQSMGLTISRDNNARYNDVKSAIESQSNLSQTELNESYRLLSNIYKFTDLNAFTLSIISEESCMRRELKIAYVANISVIYDKLKKCQNNKEKGLCVRKLLANSY